MPTRRLSVVVPFFVWEKRSLTLGLSSFADDVLWKIIRRDVKSGPFVPLLSANTGCKRKLGRAVKERACVNRKPYEP